jgi:hypothetical protein
MRTVEDLILFISLRAHFDGRRKEKEEKKRRREEEKRRLTGFELLNPII